MTFSSTNTNGQNFINFTDRHRATFRSQLLDVADRDESAPGMASSTKHPVGTRHLAAVDSLERRMECWGEEWWRGKC